MGKRILQGKTGRDAERGGWQLAGKGGRLIVLFGLEAGCCATERVCWHDWVVVYRARRPADNTAKLKFDIMLLEAQ